MKLIKRIGATLLAAMSVLLCAGCAEKEIDIPKGPNYEASATNKKEFTFYAYASISDGWTEMKGLDWYCGESFVTLEKFKELKECGFQVAMPQSIAVSQDAWDYCLELGRQAGIKILITDNAIYQGASTARMTVGGKRYESEEALDVYVKGLLNRYMNHPAFYGVVMEDEISTGKIMGSYGDLYKSIRRVFDENRPEAKIHANTLAMSVWSHYTSHGNGNGHMPEIPNEQYCEILGEEFATIANQKLEEQGQDEFWKYVNDYVQGAPRAVRDVYQANIMRARFEQYMRVFFEYTDADSVAIDSYPLYSEGPMSHMYASLQIAGMVAEENDAEFHVVSHAMTYVPYGSDESDRIFSDADMRYLNDMCLGFGVDQIMYFTYFVHGDDNAGFFLEANSFMTWYGDRTPLWYIMQKLFADNQKFAPTIKNFDYVTSRKYEVMPALYEWAYVSNYARNMGEFAVLEGVTIDKECAIVTELYDSAKRNYMYMIQNGVDPQFKGSTTYQTAVFTFSDQYNYAVVWKNGESKEVALNNHQLVIENAAGAATFVIPY